MFVPRTSACATFAVALTLVLPGAAQQDGAAPSPAQATEPPKRPIGGVETRSEVSLGGMYVDVNGSRGRFLTDRYLRSGFNLGGLSLDLQPSQTGSFFNFARLTAFGFGGSNPHQAADFRIGKRKLYDLQAGFRQYNYFFDLSGFALGLHPENSVGRWGDLRMKLFPDRAAQFYLGYGRNQQYGTAFSTEALILDTYQVSQPRRLTSDDFSLGTVLKLKPVSLTFEQSFVRFRDDMQILPNPLNPGGLVGSRLDAGLRDAPTRIFTPLSRVVARHNGARYDATGRYMYSSSDMKLARSENLLNRIGAAGLPVRQIISSSGVSDRPAHVADVSQTVEITHRLTLFHQLNVTKYSVTGFVDIFGVLRFLNERETSRTDVPFEERGGTATAYTLARNEAGLDYALTKTLSLVGAYRYEDRHIGFGPNPAPAPGRLVTITHAGSGGAAWIPNDKLRLRAELEKAASSSAYTRIEPLSSLRVKLRGELRPVPGLTVSSGAVFADNRNESRGVNYDLDDRQAYAHATYVVSERLAVNGGYNFYRIRSGTDIVFFTFARLTGGRSLYETNTHVAHADLQFPAGPRLNLRLGYQLIRDTGSTFPLRMHTPRAGVSCLLRKGISAEADWQHYSYNESVAAPQGYRANVLASGFRFTF